MASDVGWSMNARPIRQIFGKQFRMSEEKIRTSDVGRQNAKNNSSDAGRRMKYEWGFILEKS